eukprot:TRINITY_DN3252_c0_g1_i9.p1 TRINITY_DN3252_c0_g1~~TRINITY_DN3252_c0_g1_i9.p1  ORF type:complete len:543 (+),score=181.11 TRINITY_DN3252_c0_g1_i9:127-1755(+)
MFSVFFFFFFKQKTAYEMLRSLVGSVVLPVLGAVPDGAIVLFSGMGSDAQEQLTVGIGAMAGSTVLLLTIPWAVTIIAGRVNLDDEGEPVGYKNKAGNRLTPPGSCNMWLTGVEVGKSVRRNGVLMAISAIAYVIIQGSAFQDCYKDDDSGCESSQEKWYAIIAMIYAIICFTGYLAISVHMSKDEATEGQREKMVKRLYKEIEEGRLTISHVIKRGVLAERGRVDSQETQQLSQVGSTSQDSIDAKLHKNKDLTKILKMFFKRYDKDGDKVCDKHLLPVLLSDLGEDMTPEDHNDLLNKMDTNHDGQVTFEEFKTQIINFLKDRDEETIKHEMTRLATGSCVDDIEGKDSYGAASGDAEEEDEEEEPEIPPSWNSLPAEEKERRIKRRAYWLMAGGLALIMIFSDPMVDVLSEVGSRIHVGTFYVSFVLAPLASNSSEVFAAYVYGSKKTRTGTTTACETLVGAAIMNNTFVLFVFLILIIAKDLKWEFTAETLSILLIEIIMIYYTQKKNQRMFDAVVILSLYPLALGFVALLENVADLN